VNFAQDLLERYPASKPALLTIESGGERRVWHFGELSAMTAGLSGALAERGVGRGDVVMTLIGNRVEWVLAMLACWRMGAVAFPCNTQLRRGDLVKRVESAEPALAVGDEELLGGLPDGIPEIGLAEIADVLDEDRPQAPPVEPADLEAEDPAVIIFTSGTSGESRAVLHGQRWLTGQALQARNWLAAADGELVWCTGASGWSKSTRNAFIAPWLCGAAALLHDGRFDPAERLEIAAGEEVNVLCQAPTEYRMLAKRTELRPLPAMRRLVAAGEALNPEIVETFRAATGLDICDGYGQTETGHLTTGALPGRPVKPGSMGFPLPGIELRVVDGELQLRRQSCPTFFLRYLDGSAFDGEWWSTADLVTEDEDGYLWHHGRADDIIVSAGYRIGPVEVESALLTHPAVAEAAAVPAPDEERGSVVRAVIVLREGEPGPELARELQEHVKRATAPYKYPRIVEFAAELPKTSSGKIRRAALRE
jgi:acetyl-CoA synthetase